MKQKIVIGIDAGSTHLKVGIYTLSGKLITLRHKHVQIYHSRSEYSEYDADEIFLQLCECLKELLLPEYIPVAVGISSFGESVVPVDSQGRVMDKVIAWYDMRGQKLMEEISHHFETLELFHMTGQFPSGKFTLSKLLWMKENKPGLLKNAHCFLFMQDYLSFRLTGTMCTESSLASRSMLYDISKKCWSQRLISLCGLSASQLPTVVPSGTEAGTVTRNAASLTGLPKGIPVILAGHDHASASIAAGISGNDTVLDSLGTSETSLFNGASIPITNLYTAGIGFYPYCERQIRCISSIQGCGFSIEWMAKMLFHQDIFASFFFAADTARKNHGDEPIFLPYLRGLQESANASGTLFGLKDIHTKESLCYAVMEGLCFEYKRRLQSVQSCARQPFSTVRVVGRLSQQIPFMQLKADILQKNIEVLAEPEAVSQGAAILAAKACGYIISWKPKISAVYFPCEDFEYYAKRYEHYITKVSEQL